MWYGYGYDHPMMWGGGYGIVGAAFDILWIVLIVVALVALFRWLRRGGMGRLDAWHGNSALDILKERYAKGEIDHAEFEQKKKDLSS